MGKKMTTWSLSTCMTSKELLKLRNTSIPVLKTTALHKSSLNLIYAEMAEIILCHKQTEDRQIAFQLYTASGLPCCADVAGYMCIELYTYSKHVLQWTI